MLSPQTSIDFRHGRAHPDDRDHDDRGRGRLHRLGGQGRVAEHRAGKCRNRTPGPVAYGLGNTRPTVTDANVVLGRIDPDKPDWRQTGTAGCGGGAKAGDRRRMWAQPLGLDRCRRPRRSCGLQIRAWQVRSGWSASSAALTPSVLLSCLLAVAVALHARRRDAGRGGHRACHRAALSRRDQRPWAA